MKQLTTVAIASGPLDFLARYVGDINVTTQFVWGLIDIYALTLGRY